MTTSGNRSTFHPWNHLRMLLSNYRPLFVAPFPSPALLPLHLENRKDLSHGACQLSPCFPSPDDLNHLGWILSTPCSLVHILGFNFFFFIFPFLTFTFLQANRGTCGLLILTPFVFPKPLLHELFPLFLKSSITLSLHWLLPPLAINILRSPSS